MQPNNHHNHRAVVIGASMAGLAAARVLADRFTEVVLVERDDLPLHPSSRRGVPQARHAHALLAAGAGRLMSWFPGLDDELLEAGAAHGDPGLARFHQGGGYRCRFETGTRMVLSSRPLLEHHVRRRVLDLPGVSLRAATGVTGITASADGAVVTGVTLDDGTSIEADLVIDASGRAGRTLPWLERLGYELPATSKVTIDMGYASQVLRPHRDWRPDFPLHLSFSTPPSGRMGVLVPVEHGAWLLTLAGFHGDHAPTDPEGYLAFAETLPSPEIAEFLRTATPLAPVVTHRMPASQRRHVERLRHVPGGLVLLGDAVCSFNPIYGQGMTAATLQAEALAAALDTSGGRTDRRFVRAFYRRCAKAVDAPWRLATGGDFALPGTTGPKAPGTDLVNRYVGTVLRAAHTSPEVCRVLVEVTGLLRPPAALFTPRTLLAVRRALRARQAGTPTAWSAISAREDTPSLANT